MLTSKLCYSTPAKINLPARTIQYSHTNSATDSCTGFCERAPGLLSKDNSACAVEFCSRAAKFCSRAAKFCSRAVCFCSRSGV